MGVRVGWLRLAVGLGILALLFVFANPTDLLRYLITADPARLVVAALILTAATLLGAFNLHLFLPRAERPPLLRFVPLFWLAWAVGLVVPGQVGDLSTIAVALRRRGLAWQTALGRNLLDKATSLVVLGALASWGLYRWFGPRATLVTAAALGVSGVLGVLVLVWLARRTPRANWMLEIAAASLADMVQTARLHPGRVAVNTVLTLVKFLMVTSAYSFVLAAVGVHGLAFGDLLSAVAASSLVAYLPVTANGIGTAEATGVALLGTLGVPATAVLSAYLLLRALVFVLAWLPVAFWLLLHRQEAG